MTRNHFGYESRRPETRGHPPAGAPYARGGSRDLESDISPRLREVAACVFIGAICAFVALFMTVATHIPFMDWLDLG